MARINLDHSIKILNLGYIFFLKKQNENSEHVYPIYDDTSDDGFSYHYRKNLQHLEECKKFYSFNKNNFER